MIPLRNWDKRSLMAQRAHTGRRPGTTSGSYVSDLAALRKCIILCPSCVPKFNGTAKGYIIPHNLPKAQGRCDGCKEFHPLNVVHMHHENLPR